MILKKVGIETMFQVPHSVVENDPRWQMFSEGGLVDAVWDGYVHETNPSPSGGNLQTMFE